MSDWQIGDLAVCVDASPCWCCASSVVELNAIYRVTAVLHRPDCTGTGLLLDSVAPDGTHPGFASGRFRKIRPDEQEACEPEFITLLKRSKVTA